ncbi:TauD/TfdA dioxygenase family protein [Streptomyces sp. NPDC021100]|uniref:TauD/TfdA dioxygenase family protein n=1 Tax=Streptomyces sp. NPDC021100 TaxID=3365114 RepID=UPI0037AB9715
MKPPGTLTTLSLAPLAGHLGAEAGGVDLSLPLDEPAQAAIRQALLEYKVLFFRGQVLDHRSQVALGRSFGELTRRPEPNGGAAPEGFPEILVVDTKAEDPRYGEDFEERYRKRWRNYTAGWHTDLTPAVNPPAISVLRAERVTRFGGDTQWTELEAAYEALSAPVRALADGLRAEHSFFAGCQMRQHDKLDQDVLRRNSKDLLVAEHPVVRVHPETGRRCLFVNPASTSRITGLSPAQSDALLEMFFEHVVRPEFTVRWRWAAGDVAIWDNRCTAHLSPGDAGISGERRTLFRVTVLGEVPVGPDGHRSQALAGRPFEALGQAEGSER